MNPPGEGLPREDDSIQDTIVWLSPMHATMLHREALSLFGGASGLRDEKLLESALARPRNRLVYENATSLFELAACYGEAIAHTHAFVDGNKRTALLAIRAFLFLNGYRFDPEQVETVRMIEGLAAGSVSREIVAEWIEASATRH